MDLNEIQILFSIFMQVYLLDRFICSKKEFPNINAQAIGAAALFLSRYVRILLCNMIVVEILTFFVLFVSQ